MEEEKNNSIAAGLWGNKIGMTQIFVEDKVVPVTAVDITNWIVTNFKTQERDGYSAVQVGRIKKRYLSEKFVTTWLKKPKTYFAFTKEVRLQEDASGLVVGKPVNVAATLIEGDTVDVFGITKGQGFAGVVRRHNFAGPPGSHGSTMGKRPGSIGSFCSQGKVIKGKKLPGHMGTRKRVMKNLQVVKVDHDAKIMLVKGSIPGKSGSLVFLRKVKP